MDEKLEISNEEPQEYEQFETGEIESTKKKNTPNKIFSPKNIIKYTLISFTILCFIIFIYNLTSSPLATASNKIQSPFEKKPSTKKCEVGFKNSGDKCVIDYAIKGTYVTKEDNENIHLMTFLPDFPIRMTIDGKIVESTKTFTFPSFNKIKLHKTYIS